MWRPAGAPARTRADFYDDLAVEAGDEPQHLVAEAGGVAQILVSNPPAPPQVDSTLRGGLFSTSAVLYALVQSRVGPRQVVLVDD